MSFASPWWLLVLLAIPLLALLAVQLRGRQDQYAIRFPAADTLAAAAADSRSVIQHAPVALVLLGLTLLGLALAKPQRTVKVPIEGATVVLVLDHSGSMAATDVEPTRLEAAVSAAERFIEKTPEKTRVGLVSYSDGPDQALQPTVDRGAIKTGLRALTPDGATATGSALQVALTMLQNEPKKNGARPPSAIVLLSDGRRTVGSDPLIAAREARAQNVPISTVALGTPGATIPNPNFPTERIAVPPDPETLGEIASITGGRAFSASDADRLTSIYESLGSSLATRSEKRDITEQFAAAGLLVLLLGALASISLAGRVP